MMKNHKTLFTLLLANTMLLTTLTACGGGSSVNTTAETTADTTAAVSSDTNISSSVDGAWEVDKDNHWHLDNNGEQVDVAAHSLENDICSVCNAQIYSYEDGSTDVYVNNEQGDATLYLWYGSDGTVNAYTREYTYDAEGNILKFIEYINGVLSSETEYAFDGDDLYTSKLTEYYEDGTKITCEYNQYSDIISEITYDENGDAVWTITYDITYDENGNKTGETTYYNEKLALETVYTSITGDNGSHTYTSQITTYNEDGTKLIENYDTNSWLIQEVLYTADGTVEYDHTFVNEFNDQDLISSIKQYDGETLTNETKFEYDADGNATAQKLYSNGTLMQELFYTNMDGYIYVSKKIDYNEDGTQTVTEYDAYGDVIQ